MINDDVHAPLYRDTFSLLSEDVADNTLNKILPDVIFVYWEIFSNGALITFGFGQTEENGETLYNLQNIPPAYLYPVTVLFEDFKHHVKGNLTFSNLRFKTMRSGLDYKEHNQTIAKVAFFAESVKFDKIKLVP